MARRCHSGVMAHVRRCYECGAPCSVDDVDGIAVPSCREHGPLWLLVRTGATADVLIGRRDPDEVLLVRRATDPLAGYWAVVGGFVNPGESPADAARREVREELGIRVRLLGILGAYGQPYTDGEWLQAVSFAAAIEEDPRVDDSELLDWSWFDPDRLPEKMAWNHRQRVDDWVRWCRSGSSLTPPN